MSTLTIRLPDDKHARLRQLAKHRETNVNKLIEELATISIVEFNAESRFRALERNSNIHGSRKFVSLLGFTRRRCL